MYLNLGLEKADLIGGLTKFEVLFDTVKVGGYD